MSGNSWAGKHKQELALVAALGATALTAGAASPAIGAAAAGEGAAEGGLLAGGLGAGAAAEGAGAYTTGAGLLGADAALAGGLGAGAADELGGAMTTGAGQEMGTLEQAKLNQYLFSHGQAGKMTRGALKAYNTANQVGGLLGQPQAPAPQAPQGPPMGRSLTPQVDQPGPYQDLTGPYNLSPLDLQAIKRKQQQGNYYG